MVLKIILIHTNYCSSIIKKNFIYGNVNVSEPKHHAMKV